MGNAEEKQVSLLIHSLHSIFIMHLLRPDTLPGAGNKWMANTRPLTTRTFRYSDRDSPVTHGRDKYWSPCRNQREEPIPPPGSSGRLHGGGAIQLSLEMQEEIHQLEEKNDLF